MKSKRSEEIGGLLGGINLEGLTGDPSKPRHPLGDDFAFQVSEDRFEIDPRKIVLEGPYIRTIREDDADLAAFCEAVKEKGSIEQAIGIRSVGTLLDKKYILVYGMRRWKAALEAGLPRVPVRDYGPISEAESVALQMLENEARANPHPVDTAYGYHLLVANGATQAEVARIHGRDQGYVSVMRAVGDAIASLDPKAREALYRSPKITVRAFQEIATLPDVEQRSAALLSLASDPDSTTAKAVESRLQKERSPFQSRALRNGRSFRVAWKEEDLREDPVGFTDAFLSHFLEEQEQLADSLRKLEESQRRKRTGPKKPGDPDALAAAAERIAAAAAELKRVLGELD